MAGISSPVLIALVCAAMMQGAFGIRKSPEPQGSRAPDGGTQGPPNGGGQGPHAGKDGPGHPGRAPWFEALNCTTSPNDLIQEEPTTFATFLSLIDALNLTDVFNMPTPFEEVRAPTEAFFTAWFQATNTTALPDFSAYNETEMEHLAMAVLGLLAPKDLFNMTLPDGGPAGPGPHDKPKGGKPSMPGMGGMDSGDKHGMDGGPNGPALGDGPTDGSAGALDGSGLPPKRRLLQHGGPDRNAPAPGPDGAPNRPAGPAGKQGPGGDKPHANGPMPADGPMPPPDGPMHPFDVPFPLPPSLNITECPVVTLISVDAIVEGSAGCRLEDCLPCAGLDGCQCVDCRCQCNL